MVDQIGEPEDSFRIRLEFFGIPRHRIGVAEFFVIVPAAPVTIGQTLKEFFKQMPEAEVALMKDGNLRKEFLLNVSGKRFTSSLNDQLIDGDSLLMLSSDAGG